MSDERAFQVLESLGVPRKRARTIDNGIQVLAQRYAREVMGLESQIRDLWHTRGHAPTCICAACERLHSTSKPQGEPK